VAVVLLLLQAPFAVVVVAGGESWKREKICARPRDWKEDSSVADKTPTSLSDIRGW
jgi:hypothetical protein